MKYKNYYVADFETTAEPQYNIEGCTRVYLWFYENIFNDNDNDIGLKIEDFYKSICKFNYNKNDTEHKVIYFHNLSFDILFFEYYLLKIGYRQIKERITNKNRHKSYNVIRDRFNNVYSLTFKPCNNLKIEFRDSFKLLQSSVDNLPNLRGIEKLKDFDYEKIRNETCLEDFTKEEIQYIKNDVYKVKDVLKELLSKLGDKLSIASSSYADWLYNFFNKENEFNYKNTFYHIDEKDRVILRKAYNGGIVILNEKYKDIIIEEEVITFDVNSLYPSVMRKNHLPIGKPIKLRSEERYNKIKDRYKLYVFKVDIQLAVIKKGYHAYLSETKNYLFSHKKSYSDKLENTTLYLTNIDFEDLLKYYDVIYSIDYNFSYAFNSREDIFTEYIDYYYNLKENAKNEFERMYAKYRLNTLYGKFGTREELESLTTIYENGLIKWEMEVNENEVEYYLPIAIFITAYARNVLVSAIQAEREAFIYGDTDSIHCIESLFKGNIPIDNNKLGYWKLETISTKSLFHSNKQYIKMIDGKLKHTIASLNKDNHHLINFDNFKKGSVIEKGKKMKKHVKGGYIIVKTDFTFT